MVCVFVLMSAQVVVGCVFALVIMLTSQYFVPVLYDDEPGVFNVPSKCVCLFW